MKPYYESGGITIYHGDCLEILPTLARADLVLTDPPYGIGEHGGKCRTRGAPGFSKHENLGWDNERPSAGVIRAVIEAGDVAVIWGGNYFADLLPPTMGWLYWRKVMGGDFSDGELAWTSRQKALREFTKCPQSINPKLHPCEKPIALFGWCINLCCPDAKVIIDPFMGSGTTLRAAKDLGRKAIGIELEEKYCEVAVKRLAQEVLF